MKRLNDVAANAVNDRWTVDVHQHLWPPHMIEALRSRSRPPRLRDWTLELEGEPDYQVDPRHHDAGLRRAQATDDGLDLALVSLSSPLGIELLPPAESRELIDAYHEGALELPDPFGAWAAACVTDVDPDALERDLARGFVGLQLPATAIRDELGYRRVAPLLEVLEDAGCPLFVHPGPASSPRDAPGWWPAIVSYVEQMHAAWYAFRAFGRPRHPRLRVCFAMLAGLAPLHGERFLARTGRTTVVDANTFLETSSYGTRAVDATVRVLGIDVLVAGSDRPYASPSVPDLGVAAWSAMCAINPLRLLDRKEVSHVRPVLSGAQP
jgi:predicted TIM-barrel fold metal-dependent hydrolase